MDPPQTPPPPTFSQKPKFHIFFKPSLMGGTIGVGTPHMPYWGGDTAHSLREGFKKKKMWNLGFWLKLGGGGVWGGSMSPTCYQVFFLLFKNDLIGPKHEKKPKNKNDITPPSHPLNSHKILQDSLKNSIVLPVVSRLYQMGSKYSIKLFHVLKGVDLNKTMKIWTW